MDVVKHLAAHRTDPQQRSSGWNVSGAEVRMPLFDSVFYFNGFSTEYSSRLCSFPGFLFFFPQHVISSWSYCLSPNLGKTAAFRRRKSNCPCTLKQSLCPPGIFWDGIVWPPRPTACVPQVLVFVPFSLCDQQLKARPQRESGSSAVIMQMDHVKYEYIFYFIFIYFPGLLICLKIIYWNLWVFLGHMLPIPLCPAENNYSLIYNIYSTYVSYWFVLFFTLIK